MQPLAPAEVTEMRFSREPIGPSSRGLCRVTNRNSCGSGSLVGKRNGKSLVLTNAHVLGTRIGTEGKFDLPFADLRGVPGRLIMAGYSDRIMMDWAIAELDRIIDLPHTKLKNDVPRGSHYTGGYPRCEGPYFQEIRTVKITHSGTVWQWQPNSIGGQSGSGVHSIDDDLQYGLLTWSWGGNGAGQTARSIWNQYVNRTAVGIPRPEGLIELNENRAEHLEEGFFSESNITTLPIWDHLDDGDDDDDSPVDPPSDPAFAKRVLASAQKLRDESDKLIELARNAGSDDSPIDPDKDQSPDNGPLFGM